MGKKSKKSKVRGINGPRPLGYQSQESPAYDPREAAGELRQHAEIGESLGAQVNALDWKIEAACYEVQENETTGSSYIPIVAVKRMKKLLSKAPSNYIPSADCVWTCARNDFSGEALKLLLENGGIRRCNEWHSSNFSTPLSVCCSRGNVKGLKAMIAVAEQAGFTLDAGKTDIVGSEPLNYTVQSRCNNHAMGSIEDFGRVIELLVEKLGRDIESISIKHTSPPITGM